MVYYGGQELEPSHRLLRDFLVDHFVDPNSRGTVTWIDVHTGPGPSGVDTLLPKTMDGDDPKMAVKETKKWFPGIAVDDAGDSSVGAGYDMTVGFSGSFYTRLFHKDRRALFITQEFGTLPGLFVARAMILENQAFVYAPHLQPEWSQYTKDAFYVQKPAWRRSVLTAACSSSRTPSAGAQTNSRKTIRDSDTCLDFRGGGTECHSL